MDESSETKRLLEKNLAISKEALEVLKKMRKAQNMGRLLKFLKWAAILLMIFGAYYYIQPFIQSLLGTVTDIKTDLSGQNLPPSIMEKILGIFGGPK